LFENVIGEKDKKKFHKITLDTLGLQSPKRLSILATFLVSESTYGSNLAEAIKSIKTISS